MITLRTVTDADTAAIVALNLDVVAVTSPMDAARFETLRDAAAHCIVAEQGGEVVGFVLAMQEGDAYDGANFDWFSQRLRNFVYVDRIVISPAGRGHGLGRRLYDHVANRARALGCRVMAAEMDLDPPNTHSLHFHAKYGFGQLGTRQLDSGKTLSMQAVSL